MAHPNLLDIVPEQLFQTCSISEIDQVQKKLQYEIERKKEELRAMVGERYRDLIQAADTIEEMKVTTASTLDHINEMMVACKSLHNTHLIGFKIPEKPVHTECYHFNANPLHGISVQVKLLMEIPERIWQCIGADDFVKAAQLFIMARHVNTGLQLQVGGKNAKPGMQSIQRIVQQQWNSVANFNQTIIDMCKKKLQDVDITIEVATSCLVGLYLLDSQPLEQLLEILIAQHSNSSLESTLEFDLPKILEGDVKAEIKRKIVDAVKIVYKTVELVYACFVENEGGAVLEQLKNLYADDAVPLVELVQFSDPAALKLLPSVVSTYKLTPTSHPQPLAQAQVTESVQRWSGWVRRCVAARGAALLQHVARGRVLHEIRAEAFKIETPSNWSAICSTLGVPAAVWRRYLQPLLTARARAVVDARWRRVHDAFHTQILVDLTKVSSESEVEKEADINWYVWKDLIGDTVIESRNEVVTVMNALMKGMSRQDRGFTPTLEKFCETLDSELQKLLDDLQDYLHDPRTDRRTLYDEEDPDDMYSDREEVEGYLMDVSDGYVHSMLQYIKACFEEPTLQSTELQRKTTAVYTARFTQAITILMPSLRKCYIRVDPHTVDMISVDDSAVKRWNDICAVLKEHCHMCWGKWLDIVVERMRELTEGLPQAFTLEANIDYLMMQWDIIQIEEKDDEGNAIESTIKVPAGPSLKLQEYLYSVSRILDEVVPHTLPHEIHASFIEHLTSISFAHYNKVIRENETDINQRCALQLLMDVRHLTLLMVPRENKKCVDVSQEICEFLRQKIDPFDYDVFYPYIQTNLKRSVQRVQSLLGSLVLHHGELCGVLGARAVTSGGTADRARSLLAAADGHWFAVLPVAAPPLARKHDKPVKKKAVPSASPSKSKDISDIMTNSLPINFANARSGAASFFNSMTSDWFSG